MTNSWWIIVTNFNVYPQNPSEAKGKRQTYEVAGAPIETQGEEAEVGGLFRLTHRYLP